MEMVQGALDGTYIKCLVPLEEKPRYRTRKGEIATNVLGVCSPDMQFIFVLPGWEGSAADGRVLRDALDRPNGLKVPRPCYYLVDAGYTNGEGFLAPFRGQRYHLNDWRDGHQPTTPKELYNMKHSSARNVIERCFGILKARWGILRDNSYYPIELKNRIIMACCLLHNFIRQEMPNDPFETENEQDQGTGDVGGEDEDNINSVGTSNEWTAFRNNLADNMTSQKRNYRGWTSVEDEKLVEALLTMKNTSGYKADNGFKPGYVTYLETLLKVSLPDSGLLAKPHIESRIKTMKDDWQVVYDMLNSTSGFGYDKEKNCVTNDSPGVWDSYIENHPKARKWRNKKLPHYEELCVIFGKDRAQGKRSRDAFEMEQEVNTEDCTYASIISSWKKSMMITLNTKNKLKIVTGEMIEPTVESEERALIYQLVNDIVNLKQENCSIEVYYHKLKGIWDEHDALKAPYLYECYSNLRGQILLLQPLPSVAKAYGMVRQEEKQREGILPKSLGSAAFSTQSYQQTRFNNPNRNANLNIQTDPKQEGKLKGYSIGHPLHGKYKHPVSRNVNVNDNRNPKVNFVHGNDTASTSNQKDPPTGKVSSYTIRKHKFIASVVSRFKTAWVTDSGATIHICIILSIMHDTLIYNPPIHVTLPNGQTVEVKICGKGLNKRITHGNIFEGLYIIYLDLVTPTPPTVLSTNSKDSTMLWHSRLGHPSTFILQQI
ncbi:ALP1-like protein [Tanacetum coccineum]|uniref:ALP1-like protein n=1 Tax=Tanacetum coccineum TaxID=301880 RepID=A0ABQ5C711_9ASTR